MREDEDAGLALPFCLASLAHHGLHIEVYGLSPTAYFFLALRLSDTETPQGFLSDGLPPIYFPKDTDPYTYHCLSR